MPNESQPYDGFCPLPTSFYDKKDVGNGQGFEPSQRYYKTRFLKLQLLPHFTLIKNAFVISQMSTHNC
jgi:hypothetical protein